jgi:hypothetical protein
MNADVIVYYIYIYISTKYVLGAEGLCVTPTYL